MPVYFNPNLFYPSTPAVSTVKPVDTFEDFTCKLYDVPGFDFMGKRHLLRDERFYHAMDKPDVIEQFGYRGQALMLFSSQFARWNNLFIFQRHRGSGLLEEIFRLVLNVAAKAKHCLSMVIKPYELEVEPTSLFNVRPSEYRWTNNKEQIEKHIAKYQRIDKRLERKLGPNTLVFNV